MRRLVSRVVRWIAFGRHLKAMRAQHAARDLRPCVSPLKTNEAVAASDARGGRVVLLPHCALDQNARVAGAAEHVAGMEELVTGLLARGIGLVPMPCPELEILGLDRARIPIRALLETAQGRAACSSLCRGLVDRIREYEGSGIRVLGILGKDGSPTCGVAETWDQAPRPGSGVFIEELRGELRAQGLHVEIHGIRDHDSKGALAVVDGWLQATSLESDSRV